MSSLELLPEEAAKRYAQLLDRAVQMTKQETARENFIDFVKYVWPGFVAGRHHKIVADKLERVARGELKRLIINMPPRHTKSEFASFLFPAWFIGRMPNKKIMQATHTADLSVRFGRKVRNLMDGEDYHRVFPNVKLRADSKAAFRWETDDGGEYYAAGVGSNIAGRGADLFIVDDPHSEQDAQSPTALDAAWEWYMSGPRQRLQPGGAIVVVMTRWGDKDLTARLLKQMATDPKADQWEVVEFPAILDNGKSLWPEYWKVDELEKIRASISTSKWQAQYMQQPTSDTAAIIKRDWWQIWEREDVPRLQYVMQSYDTAYLKTRRWEFPDLKRIAYEEFKYWDPDTILIEAKAAGMPLTQELRQMGIPVVNFTPSRGNDKHARVNAVAPMFEAGLVWRPEASWAEEVVEEIAAFPFADHDDMVDCATQALMRFRQGGFVTHPEDYQLEEVPRTTNRVYY